MSRAGRAWMGFGFGALLLLGALGAASLALVARQRGEEEARREGRLRERASTALWRLDSAAAPLVLEESLRVRGLSVPGFGDRFVTLRFRELRPGFVVPTSAEPDAREASARLASLAPEGLASLLEEESDLDPELPPVGANSLAFDPDLNRQQNDFLSRNFNGFRNNQISQQIAGLVDEADDLDSVLRPRLLPDARGGHQLLLLGRHMGEPMPLARGAWLDWPELSVWLREEIQDLLPEARLELVAGPPPSGAEMRMSALPVRLHPGSAPEIASDSGPGALLALAWGAAALALAATGAALGGALRREEERRRFVSALTHELRTPLTTFRLYSEMLVEGGVAEASRPQYLATLRDESDRLSRVVESVLLWSRLERGGPLLRRARTTLGELLEEAVPPLERRCERDGARLTVEVEASEDLVIATDRDLVQQVLANLVDNACRYAGRPEGARLHLRVARRGERLRIGLSDEGPGVPTAERRRIFEAFRRGAAHEAGGVPGLGIGLALSRDVARALGGDLALESPPEGGALFVLELPIDV